MDPNDPYQQSRLLGFMQDPSQGPRQPPSPWVVQGRQGRPTPHPLQPLPSGQAPPGHHAGFPQQQLGAVPFPMGPQGAPAKAYMQQGQQYSNQHFHAPAGPRAMFPQSPQANFHQGPMQHQANFPRRPPTSPNTHGYSRPPFQQQFGHPQPAPPQFNYPQQAPVLHRPPPAVRARQTRQLGPGRPSAAPLNSDDQLPPMPLYQPPGRGHARTDTNPYPDDERRYPAVPQSFPSRARTDTVETNPFADDDRASPAAPRGLPPQRSTRRAALEQIALNSQHRRAASQAGGFHLPPDLLGPEHPSMSAMAPHRQQSPTDAMSHPHLPYFSFPAAPAEPRHDDGRHGQNDGALWDSMPEDYDPATGEHLQGGSTAPHQRLGVIGSGRPTSSNSVASASSRGSQGGADLSPASTRSARGDPWKAVQSHWK